MLNLTIPDMSCGHCVRTITGAIQALDPQATVNCDLASHTVQVESSADPATIQARLADEGYPASAA
ncbi:heavy-metal-associated domain-containing protein [Massilia sp. TS11]|uniref:heavy-metal-associated domain-containing protein n=1 Tax=Massilia sp. TS11 TaxID=2908003 RepID=UPI001EDBA817|nr:heavy-metal-associated domain-containing protein [Massilia sp. TS11]MCG2584193.1 heavy-metal-associated domain-containing protein [Massilia sp. TS11]